MFCLYDTFNKRVISRHRTVIGVVRASESLSRHMKRQAGNAYLPTTIGNHVNGEYVAMQPDKIDQDEQAIGYYHTMLEKHRHTPLRDIR